ncbi:tripartite tricarboxylate transporter permease [Oricola sp.]|uniref:tripartite tricarboxylate transporter permease n=1 Tax=Oricola sp. TaxID=1979950 RepID=UPI0025E65E22|nr:tripartite tricarboxylate transporter permease [Oricola sp.]MCI5074126.1 tripartite tricarboxylate transporter permease [Oricola sp.]
MQMMSDLALGFATAFSLQNLLYCFIGVFLGTFIGVLPGIGSIAAISLLLPVTFYLDPTTALVMLAGVYYGAEYGGSTAAILLNLPGTPSSAVACLDGYPLAQQGRAGVALFMTTIASFVGGVIGIIVLMAFGPLLASVALKFGPAEYVAIMVLGLIGAATIAQGSPVKGIAMVVIGITLGTVGIDVNTGTPRFTFGYAELNSGVNLIALAMGLFGVTEVIASIRQGGKSEVSRKISLRSMIPTRADWRVSALPILRGTGVGVLFGTLPGTGQTMSSFMTYALEKRLSRHPERFGNGAVEGVSAPEAANNASSQTAFIPTLTLGIPGSASMALILGAMMIHGITPGPVMLDRHPEVFWGLIASFWIGNVILLLLNIPLIGLWVRFLQIPYQFLYPLIVVLICIGTYSVNNSVFDVVLVFLLGGVGYVLRLWDFQPAPLVIGYILGPMIEENFRRVLTISGGDFSEFVTRPISGSVLAISAILLVWGIASSFRNGRRREADGVGEAAQP